MKKSKWFILFIIISFYTFSCIKKENIYIYNTEDLLINKTNDKLIINLITIDSNFTEIILLPNQQWDDLRRRLYKLSKIEIHKNNDSNKYIGFYRDSMPYNYKKDIFDFTNDWQKDTIIGKNFIKCLNTFSISYENMINP